MDIAKELSENQTCLVLVPGRDYNDVILDLVKPLSKESLCYMTLNKTYTSLKELFKKNGANIDNIVFIDGICKTFMEVPNKTDGCYFINSPGTLTELSLIISKMLRHDFKYLIFDSLTNLLIYERETSVAKFVSSIANKTRTNQTNAVFIALKMREHEELIEETNMFVDKVVDFGKKEANDEDLNIQYMNKIFLDLFGEKSIGQKYYTVYCDDKKQCEECPLKKPTKLGEKRTIVASGVAGGRTFKITHTGFKLPDGKKAILEFFEDVTDSKKSA